MLIHAHRDRQLLTLLGHQLRHIQQVPQEALVALVRLAESCEAVAVLGDDQEVHWRLGVDVPESQRLIILVYDGGRDLLRDDFIKNGWAFGVGQAARAGTWQGEGGGGRGHSSR